MSRDFQFADTATKYTRKGISFQRMVADIELLHTLSNWEYSKLKRAYKRALDPKIANKAGVYKAQAAKEAAAKAQAAKEAAKDAVASKRQVAAARIAAVCAEIEAKEEAGKTE